MTGVQTCALPIYTATTEIYTTEHTLSLHDALPISPRSLIQPAPSSSNEDGGVGIPVGVQMELKRHEDIRATMNVYGDAATDAART